MKKNILALSAIAVVVGFGSCQNSGNSEGTYTQAQLDSILKAKEDSTAAALQMQNDSALNAIAADSLAAANAVIKTTRTTTTTTVTPVKKKPTTTKPEPKPQEPKTVGNGKPSMKDDNGTVGSGKPSMKDNSTDQNGNQTVGNGKPSMK